MKRYLCAALALAAFLLPAQAKDIVDEWTSVTAPLPPALKPVTVAAKTTALLIIDMVKETCNEKARPRCVETVSAVHRLLNEARTRGAMVVFSLGTRGNEFVDALAPKNGEPVVKSGADKFINTELEKMLKDKSISDVIVVGTLANGGVLHTASQAALRGFKVVLPADGMSSPNSNTLYTEQYTAWHM